jgi:hypothetical protein
MLESEERLMGAGTSLNLPESLSDIAPIHIAIGVYVQ